MKYLLPLGHAGERGLAGGKAVALSKMAAAGLSVPDGFVVTAAAFEASCPDIKAGLPERPAAQVEREISLTLARLCPNGEPVAVRSSAREEDGARCSFAGQFDSFLAVPHDQVAQRVAQVWQSGFSVRVLAYRERMGITGAPRAPAVLVQRMVQADAAGIAFSVDPTGESPDVALVHAVAGLANALVSGECDGDCFHIDQSGKLRAQHIANKPLAWRASGQGVQAIAQDKIQAMAPALVPVQVHEVAALARRCERLAGWPQDIEWAFAGGRLWLLQSRPITALNTNPPVLWDNSNIAESYGGVTTPLTFSYIRRNYGCVYRELCRLAGVSEARIAEHDAVFGQMLGLLRGRVYYNLTSWYRLLSLIPGFRLNRLLLDQMLGVSAREAATVWARQGHWLARLADSARIFLTILCHQATIRSRVRRFEERLVATLAPSAVPLGQLDLAQIVAYQRQLDQQLLTHWDAPLVNDFFLMIFHGVLRRLVGKWFKDTPAGIDNRLLCGEPDIHSVEPARRIVDLARIAAKDPVLVERLCKACTGEAMPELPPDLAGRLHDYLVRFGDRCHDELKLESRTLHDDPAPLLRSIGAVAHMPAIQVQPSKSIRQLAEGQLARALAGKPIKRWLFGWVLTNARARMRGRENLRLARTRAYACARRNFMEMGQRLCQNGMLDQADDVLWLEIDELFGFAEGTATTRNLRALAALRRAEFEAYRAGPAPADRLHTRGAVHFADLSAPPAGDGQDGDPQLRSALGCGPGRARGIVKVVRDPATAQLESGQILVAERTDPGWVLLFPLAAALVVERGSLLSHAAIVAREMGLPTVVGVTGACNWLKDGDTAEVDGQIGTVRRLGTAPIQ